MPSFVLLVALSWAYLALGQHPAATGVLYGIKPAVTAIVLSALWRLGRRSLRNAWLLVLAVLAFAAIFVLHLPFPLIVLSAALIGYAGGRFAPAKFAVASGHHATAQQQAPQQNAQKPVPSLAARSRPIWDDDTPAPDHAQFSWQRARRVLVVGLGLWALVLGALVWAWGWEAVPAQMAWFFSKAALLTFGGAYAVLPYVQQGAVAHFHWLSAGQMMDGLALGETTPGPLIMVVTFVGFLGGWGDALFGPQTGLASAAFTALVATFFTFLPSFVFVFLGGPFIESTHGDLRFTAPLSGISAAVVGVIANLAVLFALNVLWPLGLEGRFEWPALLIGAIATIALVRQKVGVIPVILASGLAGWAFSTLLR